MRFGLLASFLAVIVLVTTMILPAAPAEVAVPPGSNIGRPVIERCILLNYSDLVQTRGLPNHVRLFGDTISWILGRRAYRAEGDGDPLWRHASWAFAGPDSLDLIAHHQAIIRLPIESGSGRAIPYVDGSLLSALLTGAYRSFRVDHAESSC
jgi:hypothetical protein